MNYFESLGPYAGQNGPLFITQWACLHDLSMEWLVFLGGHDADALFACIGL